MKLLPSSSLEHRAIAVLEADPCVGILLPVFCRGVQADLKAVEFFGVLALGLQARWSRSLPASAVILTMAARGC